MSNVSVEDTIEYAVATVVDLYVPPVLIIVGTVCNILVVMVMQSRYFRNVSTSFYMSVNAVVDIASLTVALPAHWLYVNFPWVFNRTDHSHYMCKFFNFFGWGTSDLGIILTVGMTTERAVAITFPLQASRLCSKGRAKIVVLGLLFIIFLKELHFLFTSVVVPEDQTHALCAVDLGSKEYEFFWTGVWPWVHNVFLLLSFIIIMISNIIILRSVKHSNKRNVTISGQKTVKNSSKMESRGRQLSVMLMIDSFTIIICTLPFSLITSSIIVFADTPQQQGLSKLLFSVSFYLLYVNRCANFYLYCLSGTRFRFALRQTVCCTSSPAWRQTTRTISRSSTQDEEQGTRTSRVVANSENGHPPLHRSYHM